MPPTRRARLSAFAAAFSGAIVVVMAGTALTAEVLGWSDFDHQENARAVLDADPSDPHRPAGDTDGPAEGIASKSLPSSASDDSEDSDEDVTPGTTPAVAPDDAPE
jgi:hypothetical protein